MASNIYTPPGVSVNEVVDPSIRPLLATPASLCLVGMSAGGIRRTDAIKLTGTTAVLLPSVPTDATMASDAIVSVVDAVTPALSEGGGYAEGDTGYEFDNDAHTIARGTSSTIPDGNVVYVTYDYIPVDYFFPIRMDNMADITDRFGSAYDSTGTAINSIVTYAASIAFENGASDIVLQPLYFNNNGTRQQPNDTQAANAATWADNFVGLRDIIDINLLVPVVGQSAQSVSDSAQLAILQTAQDHAKFMKAAEQQYIMVVTGEDGTGTSTASMATLRTHAQTLAGRYAGEMAEQTILVAPAKYTRFLPTAAASTLTVGGQYLAAAVGGMIASRAVSASLTRKSISGFATVAEARLKSDKNVDAGSGLCVIEQKGGLVQVRHGITTNTTSTTKREISVVRAKHRVIESVRDTLEEQVIGQVIADGEAPFVVRSAVIGVLEELRIADDIVAYSDVQARTKSLDPTEIEVRFSYAPAFPVNYVSINFSLDLTTGDVALASTTNVDTSTF